MPRIAFLILLILLTSGHLTTHAQPRRVTIDCDPGIDDALDLILAFQYPRIENLTEHKANPVVRKLPDYSLFKTETEYYEKPDNYYNSPYLSYFDL